MAAVLLLPLRPEARQPPSLAGPSKIGMASTPPCPLKCMANLMDLTTSTMRLLSMRLTEYMTTKNANRRVMKSA